MVAVPEALLDQPGMSARVQAEMPSRSGSGPRRISARNAACCPSVRRDGR
jgi:hypothetical protein